MAEVISARKLVWRSQLIAIPLHDRPACNALVWLCSMQAASIKKEVYMCQRGRNLVLHENGSGVWQHQKQVPFLSLARSGDLGSHP